jgi:hypothetical protein
MRPSASGNGTLGRSGETGGAISIWLVTPFSNEPASCFGNFDAGRPFAHQSDQFQAQALH